MAKSDFYERSRFIIPEAKVKYSRYDQSNIIDSQKYNKNKQPKQKGIKWRVYETLLRGGIEEARKLFHEINEREYKGIYTEEMFQQWISEANSKLFELIQANTNERKVPSDNDRGDDDAR